MDWERVVLVVESRQSWGGNAGMLFNSTTRFSMTGKSAPLWMSILLVSPSLIVLVMGFVIQPVVWQWYHFDTFVVALPFIALAMISSIPAVIYLARRCRSFHAGVALLTILMVAGLFLFFLKLIR